MIENFLAFLNTKFGENSLYSYAIALGIFLVSFLGLQLFFFIIKNRLKAFARKTKTNADDALLQMLRRIHPIEYAGIALYIALQPLTLPPALRQSIFIGFLILITYMVIDAASSLLTAFLRHLADNENNQNASPILMNLS